VFFNPVREFVLLGSFVVKFCRGRPITVRLVSFKYDSGDEHAAECQVFKPSWSYYTVQGYLLGKKEI
jgi:hypothetical protein